MCPSCCPTLEHPPVNLKILFVTPPKNTTTAAHTAGQPLPTQKVRKNYTHLEIDHPILLPQPPFLIRSLFLASHIAPTRGQKKKMRPGWRNTRTNKRRVPPCRVFAPRTPRYDRWTDRQIPRNDTQGEREGSGEGGGGWRGGWGMDSRRKKKRP